MAEDDKLELAAYRITERMEERFWKSVRSSATAIAENSKLSTASLGLALTTFNSSQPSIFSAPARLVQA